MGLTYREMQIMNGIDWHGTKSEVEEKPNKYRNCGPRKFRYVVQIAVGKSWQDAAVVESEQWARDFLEAVRLQGRIGRVWDKVLGMELR